MLTSIAIILLLGLLVGWLFAKIKLPSLLGMIIVGVMMVLGLVGKFVATENRYYDEVAKAEEAVADFNDNEVIGGAYKLASLEEDWTNGTYAVTVYMYTADGVRISSTVYNNVDEFIEAEF